MPNYTYSMCYGDTAEVDKRGSATAYAIMASFDAYDWPGEVGKASETEDTSPTFEIEDADSGRQLWVCAYGSPTDFQFVSYYAYPAREKRWLGLVTYDGFASPNCRQDLSLHEAREAVRLFLDANHNALVELVSVS